MELRRDGEVEGSLALFRMRWENIERDSLDWSWQRSDDDGETWTSLGDRVQPCPLAGSTLNFLRKIGNRGSGFRSR